MAFVAATGSAGTLAAGDHLKASLGMKIGVVEALECPTLLYNGYGEHNIQGIGDKHVPLIHNVMNTDFVIGVSDRAGDDLNLVFNTSAGRSFLAEYKGIDKEQTDCLGNLGLSSIANVLGAIKYAKYSDLEENDVVLTVATDGSDMYRTEMDVALGRNFQGRFDKTAAAEAFGRHLLGIGIDHMQELRRHDRHRIFNLGYYTWVEQQDVSLEEFNQRKEQAFWDGLLDMAPAWDAMINCFNAA